MFREQPDRIGLLESQIESLAQKVSSIHRIISEEVLNAIDTGIYYETNPDDSYKIARKKDIEELKNILKEAGIIVTPPKNISVPDPRGYSVNKIK